MRRRNDGERRARAREAPCGRAPETLARGTKAVPVAPALGAWGGVATFAGVVLTAHCVSKQLAAWLPAPLVPQPTAKGEQHRLVFVFGEMSRGGVHFSGSDWPLAVSYREFAVLVPSVRHPALRGPVTFTLEMWADDLRPIVLGNWVYGYRKADATIRWSGARFEVLDEDTCRFCCSADLMGIWSPLGPTHGVSAPWLSALFAQPVLGLRGGRDYVLSRFDWSLERAIATGIAARIEWTPRGSARPISMRSLAASSLALQGACWRTTPPTPLADYWEPEPPAGG